MALSTLARRTLKQSLKSTAVGTEFADVIDAGSGTLSQYARDRFLFMCNNREIGDGICDAADTGGTALTGREVDGLARMLGNRVIAVEIATAVGP